MQKVLQLVAQVSIGNRVAYGLVILLFVCGWAIQPVWTAVDPSIELWHAHSVDQERDPWGRPYAFYEGRTLGEQDRFYSRGPDGIDQAGAGDDIFLPSIERLLAYTLSSGLLFTLSAALAGLWEVLKWVRKVLGRTRGSTAEEVRRAALLALPFGVVLAVVAAIALASLGELLDPLADALLVPFPVAVSGSAYLVCFLALLWLRLARSPEAAEA